MVGPVAFYRAVPLHSPYMRLALVLITAVGMAVLFVDRASGERVVVPLLLLQMFAASTGFAVPARRGHYDLLITGGATRLRIAATHLLMSAAPGITAWLVLASVEAALNGGVSRVLAGGSLAALLTVSTLAWALTVPMPRLSGGIIWLLAIVTTVAVTDGWRETTLALRNGAVSAGGALIYAVCPFVLVGRPLSSASIWVVAPGLALALIGTITALVWITATDIPLEAPQ